MSHIHPMESMDQGFSRPPMGILSSLIHRQHDGTTVAAAAAAATTRTSKVPMMTTKPPATAVMMEEDPPKTTLHHSQQQKRNGKFQSNNIHNNQKVHLIEQMKKKTKNPSQTKRARNRPTSQRRKTKKGTTTSPSRPLLRQEQQQQQQYDSQNLQECNPTSSDPDIGILSCGLGNYCQPTNPTRESLELASTLAAAGGGDSSHDDVEDGLQPSRLGGICKKRNPSNDDENYHHNDESSHLVSTPSESRRRHRQLQDTTILDYYELGLCMNGNDDKDCDCPSSSSTSLPSSFPFDTITKTGFISCQDSSLKNTCLGPFYYGCYDTCQSKTMKYTFENKEWISLEECHNFTTTTTTTTSPSTTTTVATTMPTATTTTTTTMVCFQFPSNYSSCSVTVDGRMCTSCAIQNPSSTWYGFDFDCTNVANGFIWMTALGEDEEDEVRRKENYFANLPMIQSCSRPVVLEDDALDGYCNLCGNPNGYGTIIDGESHSFIPTSDDDTTLIPLDGFGSTFTCSDLSLANEYRQLSTDKCREASALLAQENKCCVYHCNVCGVGNRFNTSAAYDPILVTGLGNTTCSEAYYAGYSYFTISQELCPTIQSSIATTSSCCYVVIEEESNVDDGDENYGDDDYCKICGEKQFMSSQLSRMEVTLPGLGLSYTCEEIESIAYHGANMSRIEENTTSSYHIDRCSILQDAADTTCCQSYIHSCNVCGLGRFVSYANNAFIDDPNLGTLTCSDLYYGSYVRGTIDGETCSRIQGLMKYTSSCCETSTGYDPCWICRSDEDVSREGGGGGGGNGGIAFPNASVVSLDGESTVSCSWIGSYGQTGYLNTIECSYLTSLAAPSCCNPLMTTTSPTTTTPTSISTSPPSSSNDLTTTPPISTPTDSSSSSSLSPVWTMTGPTMSMTSSMMGLWTSLWFLWIVISTP